MATVRWVCISKRWHQFNCGWKAIPTKITVFVWIIWSWKCHWRWKNIAIIRKIQSATHVRPKKCGKTNAVTVSWDCKHLHCVEYYRRGDAKPGTVNIWFVFCSSFVFVVVLFSHRRNEFKVMVILRLHTKW